MEASGSDWTTGQKRGQWGNTTGSLKKLHSKDFKCTFLLCLMKAISILFSQIQHQNGQRHGITLNTAWVLSSERITGIWQALVPHKGIYYCLIFRCLHCSTMELISSTHKYADSIQNAVPNTGSSWVCDWIPQGGELLMVFAIAPTELHAWRVPESHY